SPHSMVWLTRSEAGARNIPVEPIPFVKASWAKPALLSWLPRKDPVAEVGTMDSAATAAIRGAQQSALTVDAQPRRGASEVGKGGDQRGRRPSLGERFSVTRSAKKCSAKPLYDFWVE